MRNIGLIFTAVVFVVSNSFPQQKLEDDIETAYQNAKKGIYWALTNIPEKKVKLDNNLIADDLLYASVKLFKEVNGVKIEAIGYYRSNEVKIIVYKSNDSLIKDGYIDALTDVAVPETE